MTGGSGPVLALDGITVEYPGFRLGPLTLAFSSGERVALVGANGAGKSTTLGVAGGRIDGYGGRVLWMGRDIRELLPRVRRRIGVLSEELSGYGWMTVEEHLGFLSHFYPTWDRSYEAELLKRLSLRPGAKLGALSRGMRVKLSFVAAEAFRPPVLLLDEPTSGIDPVMRGQLLEILEECAPRGGGRLLVFSSHILEDVARVCDRIVLLREGGLLEDATKAELEARAPGVALGDIVYATLAGRE